MKFKHLFRLKDSMYDIHNLYSVVQCRKCGLIFVNPQPEYSELSKHYPRSSYVSLQGKSGQSRVQALLYKTYFSRSGSDLLKIIFLPLKPLIRSIKVVPKGNFLDVGCGSGHFLALAKTYGMDCYGVEPGDYDKSFARKHGLNIFKGDIKKAGFPEDYFDVITINHVFEHLPDPSGTLKELYRILKKGGTLILATPQSKSIPYRLFGKDWLLLDVPRHLFTFSTRLLKIYAKKTGFRIEKVRYNSVPAHFLGSILLWSNRFRKKKIFFSQNTFVSSKILFFLFLPLIYLLNLLRLGDQVELFLRK